ncbi:MAG: hypothetical protein COZ16_02295 [Flavobacteriaceae bacterium CG_4_10_14_3_um_filter_31_253]|nr:MAG: hypothetical protein AUK46_03315 [Flavobacteriaceae bacterium CG2_30_31_66]PIV97196.1 MAG: hypothetical protein COW43_04005 [Flavobacteriaceae bacterium CG17_big_fil_post_rev_8_21_14_2_50_31_13]PIX13368.1 MAG: hypothetical protein COZ74_06615 [Flavobacteriaceae bacterium CG_4_8_14_3_um_filter_31_8]PIY15870.1 MAG: hypothetical protein COZ16_02295 [Flavobacteriaceae bacterium CG_4_10_14_3_um_filter_31_253]PIZ12265.1 MAG: hypothetical protein COY55_00380 [Flavobacteriaceae bacterium CG_4_1
MAIIKTNTKMNLKSLKTLVIFLTLTSCGAYLNNKVNPYHFGMTVFNSNKLKKIKEVKIYDYTENNLNYFLKQGYRVKAKSAFRERYVHMDWAELASKQLGTPIMLLKNEYVGSVSGRRALAFRIPGEKYVVTSNTNANLNYNSNTDAFAIGTNGYAIGSSSTTGNANYNSTTKTTIHAPDRYGYTSVPYKNHYYDYYAVFLVKEYREGDKKAPKKFLTKSRLKYSGDTSLKEKPEFESATIKNVNDKQVIYVIKRNVSNSDYSKVYVNGHYGYIIDKLIEQ